MKSRSLRNPHSPNLSSEGTESRFVGWLTRWRSGDGWLLSRVWGSPHSQASQPSMSAPRQMGRGCDASHALLPSLPSLSFHLAWDVPCHTGYLVAFPTNDATSWQGAELAGAGDAGLTASPPHSTHRLASFPSFPLLAFHSCLEYPRQNEAKKLCRRKADSNRIASRAFCFLKTSWMLLGVGSVLWSSLPTKCILRGRRWC